MSDKLCEQQNTWIQNNIEICESSVVALICHVVRWKERHPETCVLSAYVTQEQGDEKIWCKLTFIRPYEQG